jgi:hypothetical protein
VDRRLILALSAALSACSGDTYRALTAELPPDTDYAAALIYDASGEFTASTGIIRWKETQRFQLPALSEEKISTVAIAGWSAGDFAGLVLPREDILAGTPVRPARGCEPTLPLSTRDEFLEGSLPSGLGLLHAPWLDENCPDFGARAKADVACVFTTCQVAVEQRGCRLSFDIDNCDFGRHEFRVDWRGELCAETVPDFCAAVENKPLALSSMVCQTHSMSDCDLDFYVRPDEPFFATERAEIFPTPVQARPPGNITTFGVRPMHALSGYILDFALLEDRVVVSTHDGRYFDNNSCQDTLPSRAYFFSREDLSPIGTATTPPCLSSLVPLSGGNEYLGIYDGRSFPAIGRFDRHGQLLAGKPIVFPELAERYYENMQGQLFSSGQAYFAFRGSHRMEAINNNRLVILAFDPVSLEMQTIYAGEVNEAPNGIAESPEGRVIVSDDEGDRILYINPNTGFREEIIDLPHFQSAAVAHLSYHYESDQLIAPVPMEESALHIVNDEPQYRARAVFYEHDLAPLVAGTWPSDHSLMIVGGADRRTISEPRAVLVLLDPLIGRFLPGAEAIGFGVPSRFVTDERAVYLTLPWEGKLIRLTSRP